MTEDSPGRLGFVGCEAPADIQALYVGKRVPDELRKRGAANPISGSVDTVQRLFRAEREHRFASTADSSTCPISRVESDLTGTVDG